MPNTRRESSGNLGCSPLYEQSLVIRDYGTPPPIVIPLEGNIPTGSPSPKNLRKVSEYPNFFKLLEKLQTLEKPLGITAEPLGMPASQEDGRESFRTLGFRD